MVFWNSSIRPARKAKRTRAAFFLSVVLISNSGLSFWPVSWSMALTGCAALVARESHRSVLIDTSGSVVALLTNAKPAQLFSPRSMTRQGLKLIFGSILKPNASIGGGANVGKLIGVARIWRRR